MIDQQDRFAQYALSGGETSRAARVAICARRIGYPDMESVIMRVMAARHNESHGWRSDHDNALASLAVSAVPLALVDPGAARSLLEQVESRGGIAHDAQWDVREAWRNAWALVDLDKAQAIFESDLADLDKEKEVRLWGTVPFKMVELLIAPPDRREEVLDRNTAAGTHWRPDAEP
jgi:hypothetical protein